MGTRVLPPLVVLMVFLSLPGCKSRDRERPETPSASQPAHKQAKDAGSTRPASRRTEGDTWKPVPELCAAYTRYSGDGKLQVTVVRQVKDLGTGRWAEQLRWHYEDEAVPDLVFSWPEQEGPGAVWYPIFTHIFDVDEKLYLALGWLGLTGADVEIHARVVKIADNRILLGAVVLMNSWSEGRLLVDGRDRLGLCLPDKPVRASGERAYILGKRMGRKELLADSQPAPYRAGFWYKGKWWAQRSDFPSRWDCRGYVYWIDLKELAKKIRPPKKAG